MAHRRRQDPRVSDLSQPGWCYHPPIRFLPVFEIPDPHRQPPRGEAGVGGVPRLDPVTESWVCAGPVCLFLTAAGDIVEPGERLRRFGWIEAGLHHHAKRSEVSFFLLLS